jgi:peptidoglycan glycosyltransferase
MVLVVVALGLGLFSYALVGLGRDGRVPLNITGVGFLFGLLFGVAHVANRVAARQSHGLLLGLAMLLNVIGYAVVARLDPRLAANQAEWMVVGVAAYIGTVWLVREYSILDRYRYTLALVGLALLLSPLSPFGLEINGSRLWLSLGPLSFQPGELAKVLLVVFFASYLAERAELLATATRRLGPLRVPAFRHFGPLLLAWGASLAVLFYERDLGQSLLLFAVFLAMMWMATGRVVYLLMGLVLFSAGAVFAYRTFEHLQTRVEIWRHPFGDVLGRSYQIAQSLFAFGSGGIGGVGLGRGSPDLIPFAPTDFVFSAIGEELGLLGSMAIVLCYLLLVGTALRIALTCSDPFGKLLAAGLGVSLAVQSFVVIGGVTRLVPLTGVTLPFVSYGGSSLVSSYVLIGMLVAVSHRSAET